jgi:hypothetical protein
MLTILSLSAMGRAFVAVPQTANPPVIDGKIDSGKEWLRAVSLTNFVDIDKENFAFKQTRVWLCHDTANLYFAFKLYDSHLLHASNMRASFKNNLKGSGQKVWEDDCLEIRLVPPWLKKTKGFSHFYLAFNANAATLSLAPEGYDRKWELKCKVKTSIEEGFWQAEVKIPLSALAKNKLNVGSSGNWEFNFIRFEQATKSRSSWEIIPDKRHNETKYMAEMQLTDTDIPALKIPDITNGEIERIVLPYFSRTRFLARLWSYPWPSSLGQNSRKRYQSGDSSLLVFQKGSGKMLLKTTLPPKGIFFYKFGITYGRKALPLYINPDYTLDSDRQILVLNSKNIEKINFNGTSLTPDGKGIKLSPAPGLNTLTVKSKLNRILFDRTGTLPLPELKWKEQKNIHTLNFYNKVSVLKLPGDNPKSLSLTAGNVYALVWETGKTRALKITESARSIDLNLLLPESVKITGVSSSTEYPDGFPEAGIEPYKNLYKLTDNGTVNINNRKYTHYIISTDDLKKYTKEHPRRVEQRTRCIIALQAEKLLPDKGLKFYYYADIGKNRVPELANSCDLLILPRLNGKQPENCRFTMYYTWLNGINDEKMMNALYSTAKAAGANEVFLTNTVDPGKYGLKKSDFFQLETYAWRKSTLEMKNVFKKFPQSRTRNGGYSKYANLTYLSRHPETWPFLEEEFKKLRKREPYLTGLFWDYEFAPFAHYADLSAYTLGIFAKSYGINETLNKKVIKEKYMDKWIDFRCRELGKISSILRKIANKYGFKLNFYAAGAIKTARNRYSVDISELDADRLYLGGLWFSGDTRKINKLSREKHIPLSFSVHMCDIDRTGWQEAVILRRVIMNSGGGVLLWYELGFDGNQLTAIANVTRLTARYENFLQHGKIEVFGLMKNTIVYSENNPTPQKVKESLSGDIKCNKPGLFVYELDGKFLALLVNDTPAKINIDLKFEKSKGEIKEFFSNKSYESNKKYNVSLGAFQTAAFTGKLK